MDLIRYATMRDGSGLHSIWHGTSRTEMALLSTTVLAAYAITGLSLAVHSYRRTAIS